MSKLNTHNNELIFDKSKTIDGFTINIKSYRDPITKNKITPIHTRVEMHLNGSLYGETLLPEPVLDSDAEELFSDLYKFREKLKTT